ncbi:hypothetical protein BDW62DRAFT_83936 [Aspergillus aurantiobrunneus]
MEKQLLGESQAYDCTAGGETDTANHGTFSQRGGYLDNNLPSPENCVAGDILFICIHRSSTPLIFPLSHVSRSQLMESTPFLQDGTSLLPCIYTTSFPLISTDRRAAASPCRVIPTTPNQPPKSITTQQPHHPLHTHRRPSYPRPPPATDRLSYTTTTPPPPAEANSTINPSPSQNTSTPRSARTPGTAKSGCGRAHSSTANAPSSSKPASRVVRRSGPRYPPL